MYMFLYIITSIYECTAAVLEPIQASHDNPLFQQEAREYYTSVVWTRLSSPIFDGNSKSKWPSLIYLRAAVLMVNAND